MNTNLFRKSLYLVSTLILVSHLSQASELKLAVGHSAMANIFSKISMPFEKKTGIRLVFIGEDPKGMPSDQVMKNIDAGNAQAGAGGTTWDAWLTLMKEKNYEIKNVSEMKHQVIGVDRIQFITDPSGPKKLSQPELKKIFTGKVKNWKEVGGADRPIILVTTNQSAATKAIRDKVLDGEEMAKQDVVETPTADALIKKISSTPGAIGFGPFNLVNSTVNVPEHPVVGRPITFVFRVPSQGTPDPKILELTKFIATEGRTLGIAQ